MDNFKDWYGNRKGKYILFFGFYIVFFIVLGILLRNANYNKKDEPKKEETKEEEKKVENKGTYDITNLVNNDFKYEITINDNEEIIKFTGSKTKVDYMEFTNKYFLDIYNINQLLKKSKFVERKGNLLSYELLNSEINEVLLTDKEEGINRISLYVNDNNEVKRIVLDLTGYLYKTIYEIDINYIVGDNNENSPS